MNRLIPLDEVIARLRDHKNLMDVARDTGLTRQTLYNLINCNKEPLYSTYVKLALYMDRE